MAAVTCATCPNQRECGMLRWCTKAADAPLCTPSQAAAAFRGGPIRYFEDVVAQRGERYARIWMLRDALYRELAAAGHDQAAQQVLESISVEEDRRLCADALLRVDIVRQPSRMPWRQRLRRWWRLIRG